VRRSRLCAGDLRSVRNALLKVAPTLRNGGALEDPTTPLAQAQRTHSKRNGLLNRWADSSNLRSFLLDPHLARLLL
jgi:hypothetical protein